MTILGGTDGEDAEDAEDAADAADAPDAASGWPRRVDRRADPTTDPAAPSPVVIDTYGDHRIAMSFALVGLARPGVAIADPEVVGKSYPDFWRDLDRLLGGK